VALAPCPSNLYPAAFESLPLRHSCRLPAGPLVAHSAFRENIIDNAGDGCSGVNAHRIPWDILFHGMQSRNQFPFASSSAPLVFWPPGKALVQRVQIDVENENPVKQVNKAEEIPGAAAEEGDRVASISDQGFDLVHIPNVVPLHKPNVVLVPRAIQRFTGLWIASIRQLTVAVDGMVTAPAQFVAD